jgi:holliday junction DNA helicase RuvA
MEKWLYFRIKFNYNSMYEYISGKKASLSPDHAVIDINGVGYLLHISMTTYEDIKSSESPSLFVHLYVREDQMELYGFSTEYERNLFRLLISVSGVGTNTGRLILSALSPRDVQQAILSNNIAVFKSVKGIGSKTAQRIILDLKDKVFKEFSTGSDFESRTINIDTEEAYNALVALGFHRQKVRKALNEVVKTEDSDLTTEGLVKRALKIMT